ncbi:alanine racemase [Amycolatopsis magusensis]|uniref:alanine racemase n=1 Tax=Amycolatopsis magusensis TaxID=882444 RepID=UPI0037A06898
MSIVREDYRWTGAPVVATAAESLGMAVIDLGAIAHNTELLRARCSGELMAVVKADGFGHGVLPVATTALAHGATWLGVTSLAEALHLRAAGITAPVLSWLHLPDEDFAPAVAGDIDLSVSSIEHLDGIAASADRAGKCAYVHLKVDTGLSRNGSPPELWPGLVTAARRLERTGLVRVRGLWSHLISGNHPGDPSVGVQSSRFEEACALAAARGLDPRVRHLANSAAVLTAPATHLDLARAGIALYGVEPLAGHESGLRPAMTLRTRANMVRRVPGGTGVSYDHEYVTSRDTTLALVPLGFADGVPRLAGGRAEVLLGGRRCRVAGRVAMDQFVADAGDAPVRIGDEVVLFGPGERSEPTVAEWARWARTNPHEILTGIGNRVPRRYLPATPGV